MIGHINQLTFKEITNPEVKYAKMLALISPKEGWEGHVMRIFELDVQGHTPKHSHPWYHVNYVLEGHGELMIENEYFQLTPGSYAYVPGNKIHQFKNIGTKPFRFMCIVTEEGHK